MSTSKASKKIETVKDAAEPAKEMTPEERKSMLDREVESAFEFLHIGIHEKDLKSALNLAAERYTWSVHTMDREDQFISGVLNSSMTSVEEIRGTLMLTIAFQRSRYGQHFAALTDAITTCEMAENGRNHPMELLLRAEIRKAKKASLGREQIREMILNGMNFEKNLSEVGANPANPKRHHHNSRSKRTHHVHISA